MAGVPVIEGVVVAEEGQKAIEGAQITLYRIHESKPVARMKTDAHGRFQLFGLPQRTSYLLWVGYRGVYILDVVPGQTHTLRFSLTFGSLCPRLTWVEMPSAARAHVWPQARAILQPSICE